MGDVINLRIVRKQKARAAAAQRADENRRLFGRTTAEKAAETAVRARLSKTLDDARRDRHRTVMAGADGQSDHGQSDHGQSE